MGMWKLGMAGLEIDSAHHLTLQQTIKQITNKRTKFKGKAEVSKR